MKAVLVVIILETFASGRKENHFEYPTLEACQETLKDMKIVDGYTVAYCYPKPVDGVKP